MILRKLHDISQQNGEEAAKKAFEKSKEEMITEKNPICELPSTS